MLRNDISTALKEAMKSKDEVGTATLRLILAALKDRDIAARSSDDARPVGEDQILDLLQKMVRQRQESIELYEKAGRNDLAERETREIAVIRRFLPQPLSESETEEAISEVITELGAGSIKDMGRVMAALKERYPGRMDFGKASGRVKKSLMDAG